MEPKEIISKIMDYIGKQGIIAGGSIRDLILKRIPKDYDIFIFSEDNLKKIVAKKGIFDIRPEKVEQSGKYPSTFELYNTTLDKYPVQIIWSPYYSENSHRSPWFRRLRIQATGDDVVAGFDFTCNMVYIDHNKKVHITDEAKTAFHSKKVIFNNAHKSAFMNKLTTCEHLVRRMVYLADKLDFKVASNTMSKIYNRYGPMEKEMEALELMKGEPISAY